MTDLEKIYKDRFEKTGIDKKNQVWKALCKYYFQKLIPENATILDLACGYGEFINNINGRRKIAIDLNPAAKKYLSKDIEFHLHSATDLQSIEPGSIDIIFTSNFLEHLRDKNELDKLLGEVRNCLSPKGKFIVLGPNIKYAFAEYWDYYDHYLPLSHLSLAEGMTLAGFNVESTIGRFLPYTMNNDTPTYDIFIRIYLAFPIAWKIMGKQFLVVAGKGE